MIFLQRGATLLCSGGKSNAQATATTSTALKLLASEFLPLHPSFADRVSTILFGLLLASPKVKADPGT